MVFHALPERPTYSQVSGASLDFRSLPSPVSNPLPRSLWYGLWKRHIWLSTLLPVSVYDMSTVYREGLRQSPVFIYLVHKKFLSYFEDPLPWYVPTFTP